MINSSVFNIAVVNATALQDTISKRITPTGNSMLSNLVGLSYVGSIPTSKEITYADVLQATTQDTVEGPSLHTNAMANEIETLTPLVAGHISFIRNTVCPKVNAFEQLMASAVARVNDHDPMGSFDIVQVSAPTTVTNEDFMALVNQFADGNVSAPSVPGNMPVLALADISKAMQVSSASVNKSIQQWIAERGDGWLEHVWHHYFSQGSAVPTIANPNASFAGGFIGLQAQSPFQRLDTALAVFLIARGLFDEPLEDANMPLPQWRAMMDQISRFAAHQAQIAISQVNTVNQQEILILGTFNEGRRILVNAPIYARYLEEGGKVEDVLGAAISNRAMSYPLSMFREDGEGFAKVFNTFKAVTLSGLQATAVTRLRAEAKAAFIVSLDDISEDEAIVMSAQKNDRAALIARAEASIDAKVLPQLENVSHLAIELIAGLRFVHTPARQFLLDIKAAEEAGCTCPKEAAGIAAFNYLCSYAASNLALTN